MPTKTKYSEFDEINELQTQIMVFIDRWVREVKTPVPRKEIMNWFIKRKVLGITTEGAINALLKKGYIRRGYSGSGNKAYYVLLRTIRTS